LDYYAQAVHCQTRWLLWVDHPAAGTSELYFTRCPAPASKAHHLHVATAMREFVSIVVAGFISSLLGAAFGWTIGEYAPEVVEILFPFKPIDEPSRVAPALGAIAGLLLGAITMTAGLFIAALRVRKS
jgi:hypothetical protein